MDEEERAAERFSQYAQSTAFTLVLSHNMVAALRAIDELNNTGFIRWTAEIRYVAVRCLMARGLIYQPMGSKTWVLSKAGKLALELCRVAGCVGPASSRLRPVETVEQGRGDGCS